MKILKDIDVLANYREYNGTTEGLASLSGQSEACTFKLERYWAKIKFFHRGINLKRPGRRWKDRALTKKRSNSTRTKSHGATRTPGDSESVVMSE